MVRFLAEAEQELDDAVAYYEALRPELGHDFALAVLDGLERIMQFPHGWQR